MLCLFLLYRQTWLQKNFSVFFCGMWCFWQIGKKVNHQTINLYRYPSSMLLTYSVYSDWPFQLSLVFDSDEAFHELFIAHISDMTWLLNSLLSSDCNIGGAPNIKIIGRTLYATSSAQVFKGCRWTDLVKCRHERVRFFNECQIHVSHQNNHIFNTYFCNPA